MRFKLVCAAAIVASLACVSTAGAGDVTRYRTTVTVDGAHAVYYGSRAARGTLQGYHFFGHMDSRKPKCAKGRKVTLFRSDSGPDTRMGRDVGDSHQSWSVFVSGKPVLADYYVKVAKRKLRNGDICRPAQSEDFLFQQT